MEFLFTVIGFIYILYLLVYLIVLTFADSDLRLAWADKFGVSVDCLRGKVVWITGASSGIGRSLALKLAAHGVKLVLSSRSRDELLRVRDLCIEAGHDVNLLSSDVLVLQMNVLDVDKHEEYFKKVINHFGQLDVLVNNAGRTQRATWESIDIRVDREIFDLNVFSIISLSRIAVRYFLERGSGHLAATSSIAGILGVPFSGSYTGSKHALHGYFESLRAEKITCPGLQITLLCPGPVFTNFLSEAFTNQVGEKFGESVQDSDKRMTSTRCAHLFAVALANKLDEAWIALFPIVPLAYFITCFPNIGRGIIHLVGAQRLQKLRDSRETVNSEHCETPKTENLKGD